METYCCSQFRRAVEGWSAEDVEIFKEATSKDGSPGESPSPYPTSIGYSKHVGLYTIAHSAIRYCPWCGSQLADESDEAMAEFRKTSVQISVDPSGEVHVEVAGEPVDAAEFMSNLKGAVPANDQD